MCLKWYSPHPASACPDFKLQYLKKIMELLPGVVTHTSNINISTVQNITIEIL
jgi:hypothetical protein